MYTLLFISLYFEVFLLITFFEWQSYNKKRASYTTQKQLEPSTTIIVPCFNVENTVVKTIHSLLALNYPKEKLSLIIVDDGSTDNTWETVQQFATHSQISLFQKENGGKHTALNFALNHTTSELVGCLDADSFVDTNALREIVRYFDDPQTMAVTPAIKVHKPRTLVQYIQKAEYSLSVFIRRVFSHINTIFITPGPFSIFRRQLFETVGIYKAAHNTEDLEIALRIQDYDYKIENAHTAMVYTTTPETFRKLFRQRLRWSYGFIKNIYDYRHLFFSRKNINLGFLILPFAALSIFSALYFVSVAIASLLGNIISKIIEVQIIGGSAFIGSFDLFYINTHALIFIVSAIVVITLSFILIGKKISQEQQLWSYDILVYLFLYGFLTPLWLVKAVYNVAFSQKTKW